MLNKPTQTYRWERDKNCRLDFDDLNPIFKITGGKKNVGIALSVLFLLKECMDFNQTCTDILLGDA